MGPLLALFVTFGLMWVLLVLPQQRRVRQHQAVVAALRVGDEVITAGGVYGTIVSDDDDMLGLEVAPGVVLRVLRGAVSQRVGPSDDDADAGAGAGEAAEPAEPAEPPVGSSTPEDEA